MKRASFGLLLALAAGPPAVRAIGPSIFSTVSGDLVINSSSTHPDSQVSGETAYLEYMNPTTG